MPAISRLLIRGRPAWIVGALLNGGVLLFAGACLWGDGTGGGPLLAAARAAEAAAVLLFGVPLAVRSFR